MLSLPGSIFVTNVMSPPDQIIQRAAVIGAGAWGTTLARHLARKGLDVRLWAYESEVVESMRLNRENSCYLAGVHLPDTLFVTGDFTEAIKDAQVVLFATPSHAMRSVLTQLRSHLSQTLPLIIATKGIEEGTLKVMSQVLQDVFPPDWHRCITVLSGPSFAIEVCKDRPTAISLMGEDSNLVHHLQTALMTPRFRVYVGTDLIGAQLGGALKNVMAIAAGIVDGLALGYNTRAALMTRGLAEIVRLGLAMGAQSQTLYGLSGLGDLVLTCTGPLSRNHTVGLKIGQGQILDRILQETPTVAEGVRTARAAVGLAHQFGVEMPIVQGVYAVLFEGKAPDQVVSDLMTRTAKGEIDVAPTIEHVDR